MFNWSPSQCLSEKCLRQRQFIRELQAIFKAHTSRICFHRICIIQLCDRSFAWFTFSSFFIRRAVGGLTSLTATYDLLTHGVAISGGILASKIGWQIVQLVSDVSICLNFSNLRKQCCFSHRLGSPVRSANALGKNYTGIDPRWHFRRKVS